MRQIREHIIPARGVRVRWESIPNFPAREILAEEYDLDENGLIQSLYSEMDDALRVLEQSASGDINAEHPLTKILRARQRIELLKVPIAVALAEDYLAKGYSPAMFCNFRQTIDELSARLGCSAIIDGSAEGVRERQNHIDAFQSNRARLIILNNEAGGVSVSLQDLCGTHPRVGIVFPNFSAVSMRQVFGRLHRDGGKSPCHYRVLFASGTCEAPIARALRAKCNNLDALNDSDLQPENFRLRKSSALSTVI